MVFFVGFWCEGRKEILPVFPSCWAICLNLLIATVCTMWVLHSCPTFPRICEAVINPHLCCCDIIFILRYGGTRAQNRALLWLLGSTSPLQLCSIYRSCQSCLQLVKHLFCCYAVQLWDSWGERKEAVGKMHSIIYVLCLLIHFTSVFLVLPPHFCYFWWIATCKPTYMKDILLAACLPSVKREGVQFKWAWC